jgi:hypothetical protein
MYVAAETAIVINGTPEAVWEYASDPSNWTASNPEEHIGLEYFDSKDNRPATGVEFYQRASVAGVYADLRGRFLHVDRPRIAVWAGTAVYRMFGGLIHVRIPRRPALSAQSRQKAAPVFLMTFTWTFRILRGAVFFSGCSGASLRGLSRCTIIRIGSLFFLRISWSRAIVRTSVTKGGEDMKITKVTKKPSLTCKCHSSC